MFNSQYQKRYYRNNTIPGGLTCFSVVVEETDLFICADSDLSGRAVDTVIMLRSDIKKYIRQNPDFGRSLEPVAMDKKAPDIVRDMLYASNLCDVGPMAAVAGALAEMLGKRMLKWSSQVIVENGGDIFISSEIKRKIGIYLPPESKFNGKLAIQVDPEYMACGICTSSATVGHSLSFGKADAVTVIARQASVADACATALCNMVKSESDIDSVIKHGKSIRGIIGILIVIKDKLGLWGNINLAS
jgi:uncharacterized protein